MSARPHAAWLPDAALAPLGSRRIAVAADETAGPLVGTVLDEARRATATHGGSVVAVPGSAPVPADAELVLRVDPAQTPPEAGVEGFTVAHRHGTTIVTAATDAGLLHGYFHVVRGGGAVLDAGGEENAGTPARTYAPAHPLRMLDHWDNLSDHAVMGPVERGYAGASIFYLDGHVREDLSRVGVYARLLAATGINRVAINNVNVHADAALLLTEGLPDVARIAAQFRPFGISASTSP